MVLEVPTVAPATTGTAEAVVSMPAVTKPMVASTVALEACVATVIAMPAPNPRAGRAVTRCSDRRRPGPASDFRPSVRSVIPRRNSPTPPSSCAMPCQWTCGSACNAGQLHQDGRASPPTRQDGIQEKSRSSIGLVVFWCLASASNSPASK